MNEPGINGKKRDRTGGTASEFFDRIRSPFCLDQAGPLWGRNCSDSQVRYFLTSSVGPSGM